MAASCRRGYARANGLPGIPRKPSDLFHGHAIVLGEPVEHILLGFFGHRDRRFISAMAGSARELRIDTVLGFCQFGEVFTGRHFFKGGIVHFDHFVGRCAGQEHHLLGGKTGNEEGFPRIPGDA